MNGLAQPASPLSVSSLAQLTLSLVAIVALIFAMSWALKRFKLAGPRGAGEISIIDQLTLGPRERILLIRVGDTQVLVGIAAQGMVALTPLTTPVIVSTPVNAPLFADRLRDFIKRPGDSA